MPYQNPEANLDARLDELFLAYRDACPEPVAGVNFMPQMWAKIEARENSSNWFGRIAKALVTVALATSVVLALLISASNQPGAAFLNGTLVEAVTLENVSMLEPFHLDRIAAVDDRGAYERPGSFEMERQ